MRVPLSLQLGTNKYLHVRKLSKVGEITIAKDQREQHSELMQANNSSCFYQTELGTSEFIGH